MVWNALDWSIPDLADTFKTRDDEAAKFTERVLLLTLYKPVHETEARPVF